jgi:hypothetical protein
MLKPTHNLIMTEEGGLSNSDCIDLILGGAYSFYQMIFDLLNACHSV